MKSYRITVSGLVQGVGFRPFVYRIAREKNLSGWVTNRTDSVLIYIEGQKENIDLFISDLSSRAPVLARIDSVEVEETVSINLNEFTIHASENNSDKLSDISPDIAVCEDCLEDMQFQTNRLNYPFVNCTNCGPRFSIIKDFPYDRKNTTMNIFMMCESCSTEYNNVSDRRFHAQPVACMKCGPRLELHYNDEIVYDTEKILDITARLLEEGKILLLKGIGGFQLICDATSDKSVDTLRLRKNRDGKPFAVMMRNMATLCEYVYTNLDEEKLLNSFARPIVILQTKKPLAYGISQGLPTTGCLLPYMPIHYLLFKKLGIPAIVFTSGNISGEPIVIDNDTAIKKLRDIADAVLIYNRDIYNRTDDSVANIVSGKPVVIRRSRGYVPQTSRLNINSEGILACGSEQKVTFALGLGQKAVVSQHIGDLDNIETLDFYEETLDRYKRLFRFEPEIVACDLHPDYLSTRYAEETGLPVMRVQHHHAHICSGMAEYGIDREVVGVAIDGTGYGDDGAIWGSEFMLCSLQEYERVTHLEYFPLPGGDMAVKEPWRTAVACLYHTLGIYPDDLPGYGLKKLDSRSVDNIIMAIDNRINTPLTSSMGRLFDAVAAMLGLCNKITFEAEGPIRLESIADTRIIARYGYDIDKTISIKSMLSEILADITCGVDAGTISGKFHNTMIDIITRVSWNVCNDTGIGTVVLSGGIFQNRIILGGVLKKLSSEKLNVLIPALYPVNDGGISLGQLVCAAKRRNMGCV